MNKTIHYIWLGNNPKSKLILKCIDSWRKYMPDWEIFEWNESNLDIDCNEYVRKAYNEKKYAFASDFFRFDILMKYGGLYLDTDVEIIRPFQDLLEKNDCVVGFEYNKRYINPGLILFSSSPGNIFITEIREHYLKQKFQNELKGIPLTVCQHTTGFLYNRGLECNDTLQTVFGVTIYPSTYFCPTNREWSIQNFSVETRCIHHYSATWLNGKSVQIMIKRTFFKIIGIKGINILKKLRYLILNK